MLTKVGDWRKASRVLNPAALNRAMERTFAIATKKAALVVERKIKEKIRGRKTPSNKPLTILRKRSSKPLVDTGDLFKAVTHIILGKTDAWIGVPETKRPGKAITMADIARILEFGTTRGKLGDRPKDAIIVPRRAKALFIPLRKGVEPNQEGLDWGVDFILARKVRIKPRPFVGPAIKESEPFVLAVYEQAMAIAIQGLLR